LKSRKINQYDLRRKIGRIYCKKLSIIFEYIKPQY
jgi:hypothetical protein